MNTSDNGRRWRCYLQYNNRFNQYDNTSELRRDYKTFITAFGLCIVYLLHVENDDPTIYEIVISIAASTAAATFVVSYFKIYDRIRARWE